MNKMINKTVKWMAAAAAVIVLFGACSKDEDPGVLLLDSQVLLVDAPGQTGTVGFIAESLGSISLSKIPAGWTITADLHSRTITATAPAEFGGTKGARSGRVSVVGYTLGGHAVTTVLFVSVASKKDLSSVQSNSMILSEPYMVYTFDATRRGETTEVIPVADVQVIWQTESNLIQYPEFKLGRYSFYVDGQNDAVIGGNALLGAYDAAGQLLTTWHLWIVDAAAVKEQPYANGKTFMSLNLGALGNTNATNDEILASYGLFYQWGRKEPFVGPNAYNAAKAEDHLTYDVAGRKVKFAYVESTAETGTAAYAAANPMVYILGVKASEYDWLFAARSSELWADKKTANDPCPKGWRVPSKSDFAGLQIVDMAGGKVSQYGWNLTDGTVTAYYPGAGFRPYLNGRIQNIYNPISGVEVPMPWVGYYWTNGIDGNNSSAMYFWFDATDPTKSGIETAAPQYRSNGMQIRCVKE